VASNFHCLNTAHFFQRSIEAKASDPCNNAEPRWLKNFSNFRYSEWGRYRWHQLRKKLENAKRI